MATFTGKNLRPGDAFINEDGTLDIIIDTYRPKSYPLRVGFILANDVVCTVGTIARVEIEQGASKDDCIKVLLDSPAMYWDSRPER